MTPIGIQDLELATSHHVLDLADLAAHNGTDPAKYTLGLGQDEMSILAPDEDIVTMAATAASRLLARTGSEGIRTILFATESGVDQSKAAGVWVHRLLGLPSGVRVVELKQACYGGTAALQAAIGIVARAPGERVLVITSDVARYALDSPGEPTQGAAAVAVLVGADPALMTIEAANGLHTADVDDFWRPNDSTTAVVDGALSVTAYLDSLVGAWDDLRAQGGPEITEIDRIIYHQPFTKMAKKAQQRLAEHTGASLSLAITSGDAAGAADARDTGLATSSVYNRRLGNSYTASLFSALTALLDRDEDLEGRRVAMFSYGSGSVGELVTGVVQPGYAEGRDRGAVQAMLDARVPLSVAEYRALHTGADRGSSEHTTERVTTGPFRFTGVSGQARDYERLAG